MLSRTALSRGARLAARRQGSSQLRGYAAAASSSVPPSLAYETADVAGVKVATRDSHGPTTKLAVVARAGTRYEPAPGLTVGLEEFAFKVSWRAGVPAPRCGVELIRCNRPRTPYRDPPCALSEKPSSSAANWPHTTPERPWSSRPASCARTSPTSLNYWPKSSPRQSTPVSCPRVIEHGRLTHSSI